MTKLCEVRLQHKGRENRTGIPEQGTVKHDVSCDERQSRNQTFTLNIVGVWWKGMFVVRINHIVMKYVIESVGV